MRWAAHASTASPLERAADEARALVEARLGGPPDLLFVFTTPGISDAVAARVSEPFPDATVVGCAGGGVIAHDREIEDEPSVALIGARLPDARLRSMAFGDGLGRLLEPRHLRARLAPDGEVPALVVVLLDSRMGDPHPLLNALDAAFPGTPKLGGLAVAGRGGPALLVDGRSSAGTGVLVAIHGGLAVEPLVAQGCRPVGQPMLTTRCSGNVIHELGQRPPMEVMRELIEQLPPEDAELFRRAPFIGIEMRDQIEYQAGDFLLRNIIGADPSSGALAVGAHLEGFKAVQFHVRDGRSAAEELGGLLERASEQGSAEAVLLFSCLGRGKGLFGVPHHDTRLVRARLGLPPVGGFFGGGEIGPVGGTTHLHAYTSAAAIIRERQ